MSPDWPGNASVSPRRGRRKCPGRGKSGHLCLDCCPRDPAPDKRKMYGLMDGNLILLTLVCVYRCISINKNVVEKFISAIQLKL